MLRVVLQTNTQVPQVQILSLQYRTYEPGKWEIPTTGPREGSTATEDVNYLKHIGRELGKPPLSIIVRIQQSGSRPGCGISHIWGRSYSVQTYYNMKGQPVGHICECGQSHPWPAPTSIAFTLPCWSCGRLALIEGGVLTDHTRRTWAPVIKHKIKSMGGLK